ncbi:MAG: 50S ribosomal protein L14e [Nanoarchaeota archaeon]
MLDIGRVCVKIAGREAGRYCVVVDRIDDTFVLIDGDVRRKRCNILHLEPVDKIIKIKKGADTKTVVELMKKEGVAFKKRPKIDRKKKEIKDGKKEIKSKKIKKPEKKEAKKTKVKIIKTKK